jgi:hypothetical protein
MATFYPAAEHFQQLSSLIAEPGHWRALVAEDEIPLADLGELVGRLRLLYGVPFRYLVPDSRMLPPESIRFFYVDENWIDALTDGAASLGRITTSDRAHDHAVAPLLREAADDAALDVRRKLLKRAAAPAAEEDPKYTGFLMRSAVVAGWPGLEVEAFQTKEGTGAIEMSRMDRLAPDVLICIFPKVFQSVNIHEPKEGVAFGAKPIFASAADEAAGVDPVAYRKQMRGLGIGGYKVGDYIPDSFVDVPLRSSATRVVSMTDYKSAMVSALLKLKPPAWDSTKEFTSAQFALEAVQGASQFIFQATPTFEAAARAPRRRETHSRRQKDVAALNQFLFEK